MIILTIMLLVDSMANKRKTMQKPNRMTDTLAHVYSPESTPRELSDECQHDMV